MTMMMMPAHSILESSSFIHNQTRKKDVNERRRRVLERASERENKFACNFKQNIYIYIYVFSFSSHFVNRNIFI